LFRVLPNQSLQARGDKLLKPVARVAVDVVALGKIAKEALNKSISLMVRQTHHERNQ